MIKDQMLLGLRTDTANYKDTVYCFTSATDDEILPYTIGYIPWDIMSKCRLFGACGRAVLQGIPETTFNVYKTQSYFDPTKGVPFLYTSRTGSEQSFFHGNYTGNQWSVSSMYGDSANTNLRILAGYNTDYYVQNPSSAGLNIYLNTIHMRFKFFEVLGDGSWSGNNNTTSEMSTRDVDATVTDPENIGITFSITFNSGWPTHTYTITQDDWLNCDENGVFFVDGGTYERGGVTYNRTLVGFCIHISTQQIIESTLSPGMGMLIAENFRNVPAIGNNGGNCCFGSVRRNNEIQQFLARPYDYHKLFQAWYGDEFEFTDDTYFIRTFVITESNNIITCGATFEDLQLIVCTSFPLYRIGNNFYVAEFTDDYYITGKLIPYSQAREWQKNINGDSNNFDPADIPEPGPEPGGEDWEGDRILPPVISGIGDLNGFITMYGMTPSQVAALGSYLWAKFTDTAFWESISAVLDNTASVDPSNILNYVVSIRAYPFDLTDVTGTTRELPLVYFGRGLVGIPVGSPTTLSLRVIHKCVDSFAGGDLQVPAYYGDFRDMEPCAKLLLHVPFCGSCEINPSQVVGKHLFLRYTIDFATGGMMAICYTSDSAGDMAYPVAELHGHVGASVQLTGSNEIDALQSIAGVGSGIASLMMGNPSGLLSGVVGAASSLASNRAVPHTTGRASGFSAYFQPRVPYIEIVYDQYYKPSNYAHTHGNACQAVKKIGDLHGYTVCKNVDTSGLTCEGDERIVIKRILESGFYVD